MSPFPQLTAPQSCVVHHILIFVIFMLRLLSRCARFSISYYGMNEFDSLDVRIITPRRD